MKHTDKCNCPIHVEEDTTKVKYAAWAVIVLFVCLFLLVGCRNRDQEVRDCTMRLFEFDQLYPNSRFVPDALLMARASMRCEEIVP